ncbi:MAG: FHA domain-containing protein, partial [Planctomycetota bacterium]
MVALVDAQDVLLPRREISLHVSEGPLRGAFFPTSWCDLLLLGRAPSNHVVLPHEMVSAHHCLLVRQRPGIKFRVIDARSRHGTWVNGQQTVKAVVGLGDKLAIGPFEMEFVDSVSVQRPPYDVRPAARRRPVFAVAPWKGPG